MFITIEMHIRNVTDNTGFNSFDHILKNDRVISKQRMDDVYCLGYYLVLLTTIRLVSVFQVALEICYLDTHLECPRTWKVSIVTVFKMVASVMLLPAKTMFVALRWLVFMKTSMMLVVSAVRLRVNSWNWISGISVFSRKSVIGMNLCVFFYCFNVHTTFF